MHCICRVHLIRLGVSCSKRWTQHVFFLGPFLQGTIRFVSRPEVSQPASPNTTPGGTRPPGDWLPPLKCKPTEPSTPASKCTGFGCDLCSRELRDGNAFWRGGPMMTNQTPPPGPAASTPFVVGVEYIWTQAAPPVCTPKKAREERFRFVIWWDSLGV